MRTRPGGADPVAVKEDHDLPNDLLLRPGVRDPLCPNRANARHLAKAIGLGFDDVEDPLPEGLDHLLCVDRPDGIEKYLGSGMIRGLCSWTSTASRLGATFAKVSMKA